MFARKNWYRAGTLILFMCALVIVGCGKNADTPKPIDDPPAVAPKAEPKKTGDITMDDLRTAAKTAGGDLDKSTPTPNLPPSVVNVKPDVLLTPKSAADEYKKDGLKRCQGQVVEVTGTVGDLGPYGANGSTIYLREDNPNDFGHMHYTIRGGKAWTQVFPLQTVTLRARIATQLVWDVVGVKGPPPTSFTAEQFTSEQKAGVEEFDKKYEGKYLIVTGIIVKVGKVELDGEFVRVWLQGVEKTQMPCTFRGPRAPTNLISQQQRDYLKVGQQVKVLGRYVDDHFDVDVLLDPAP